MSLTASPDRTNVLEPPAGIEPEQDAAIEGYMRDLLGRMRQNKDSKSEEPPNGATSVALVSRAPSKSFGIGTPGMDVDHHDEALGVSLTSSDVTYDTIAHAEAEFVAKSIARRRFIETEADIMELRALANDVSRRVIAIHNRRRKKEHFWNKVFISIVALLVGIVLLVLSGLGGAVVLSGAYVAMIVSIVFGHDAIGLAKRFFYRRRAGDRARR